LKYCLPTDAWLRAKNRRLHILAKCAMRMRIFYDVSFGNKSPFCVELSSTGLHAKFSCLTTAYLRAQLPARDQDQYVCRLLGSSLNDRCALWEI